MKVLNARERGIVELLKEGLTLSAIAERMSTTRSTIGGVVHRLKAAGVPGIHCTGARRPAPAPFKIPRPRKQQSPVPAEAAPAATGPLTLLELKRTSCRFILGDDLIFYCGEVAETAPYCAAHRKACYTVRQTPA